MKKIVLQACCAPCASYPIIKLIEDNYIPVIFFYNPNIYPLAEYETRRDELKNYCSKIGVEFFVHDALKPKARGYNLASKEMKLDKGRIGAVGDQVFTDVWGAKRAGCYAIYTKPLHKGGEGFLIALKRLLEKPFLKRG